MKTALLTLGLFTSSIVNAGWFGPETFEECIAKASNAPTGKGVELAAGECYSKSYTKPSNKKFKCPGNPDKVKNKPFSEETQRWRIRDGDFGSINFIEITIEHSKFFVIAQSSMRVPISAVFIDERLNSKDKDPVGTYRCHMPYWEQLDYDVAGKFYCPELVSKTPNRYYRISSVASGNITYQQLLDADPSCKKN